GSISFSQTGLTVELADDVLGAPVPPQDGWYSGGKMPVVFVLNAGAAGAELPAAALARLRVRERDATEPTWPQRSLASFTPAAGQRQQYSQSGGEMSGAVLQFAKGGGEKFAVDVPAGAELILRKRFVLDEAGHEAEVLVNGKSLGKWDLKRSDP